MPPSSAFSHRRQILRRPKICLPPPPPPPPPPSAWPPETFVVQWIANWEYEEESFGFNRFLDFLPVTPGQVWDHFSEIEPNTWQGEFQIFEETSTATLVLEYFGEGDECGCEKISFPLTWGISTLYAITTWDDYYPDGSLHEAHFTF